MTDAHFATLSRADLAARLGAAPPENEAAERGYALVSVAQPEEFACERLPGSINIPLGEEARFVSLFAPAKEIILYGDTGSAAPAQVAAALAARGYTAVKCYPGGLQDWKAGGMATDLTDAPEHRYF